MFHFLRLKNTRLLSNFVNHMSQNSGHCLRYFRKINQLQFLLHIIGQNANKKEEASVYITFQVC